MSITPIERDEKRETRGQSRNQRSGVRARLRSWLASVGERIRAAVAQFGTTSAKAQSTDPEDHQSGQIRVGGQRRLEGRQTPSADDETPHGGALPGRIAIDAEREDDTLRVYNPNRDGAYIRSDTWEDVER